MALGRPNVAPEVAACYDCHGHHDVLPASDPPRIFPRPTSSPPAKNAIPGANANFAEYIPHANPLDGEALSRAALDLSCS